MNDDFLRGKKILFIGPIFYNYHNEIVSKLENMGADINFYAEKPIYKFFIMNYLFVFFKKHFVNKYLNKILKDIQSSYHYVFIIRGELMTKEFLNALKYRNPNAKFIMYQWDSIKNNSYDNLLKYFDKILTFDMIDAKKLNIEYLPLFYVDNYKNLKLKEKRKYDIVFFGSYHGDRLSIIKQLDIESLKLELKVKFHLYIPKTILFKRILTKQIKLNELKYLSTSTVSEKEILKYYADTKTVLDIENKNQNGLTIRTFEVLGSGLKLITTNKNILNDRIHNKKDIYVLDRNKLQLDSNFFNTMSIKNNNYINYSLNNWIKNVFN